MKHIEVTTADGEVQHFKSDRNDLQASVDIFGLHISAHDSAGLGEEIAAFAPHQWKWWVSR